MRGPLPIDRAVQRDLRKDPIQQESRSTFNTCRTFKFNCTTICVYVIRVRKANDLRWANFRRAGRGRSKCARGRKTYALSVDAMGWAAFSILVKGEGPL
jgi:hypothetical protein